MRNEAGLVKYLDVLAPSKKFLVAVQALGGIVCVLAATTLVWAVVKSRDYDFIAMGSGYCKVSIVQYYPMQQTTVNCEQTGSAFLYWVFHYAPFVITALGAVGVFLLIISSAKHYNYHECVRQGKIIRKDIFGGGYYPVEHKVLIEGYTYANELRTEWRRVSAGYWHDTARVGDLIDLRNA